MTPAVGETIKGFEPLAGAGILVHQNGGKVVERWEGVAAGLDRDENIAKRAFTARSPFRVASMSKVVTLLTAKSMAGAGVLQLDAGISDVMGVALRHPNFPNQPITLQNLLSHRSGISDPAVYWTQPSGDIRDLLSPDMFKGGRPGEWFEYANINYGIAATVMEARSGERFDQLTQRYVLTPLGLDAGFNWADVSDAKRQRGATLYRKVDGEMRVQTDGPDILAKSGPVLYGDDPDFVFENYEPAAMVPCCLLRADCAPVFMICSRLRRI
ncbi:serine hydrolase domain-containing protein [Robiginitomaculum antarcticum]|uniref:serine hydrolase domain-containing protein n=1 Tax=Robiginitomaculum antarcticum TaxID=437507 RepID=UPI00047814A6|nr:serine hydrolase domain-containing protein [Robiginitomaculum antarcticum]